jgi:hypothetical protein
VDPESSRDRTSLSIALNATMGLDAMTERMNVDAGTLTGCITTDYPTNLGEPSAYGCPAATHRAWNVPCVHGRERARLVHARIETFRIGWEGS